MYVGPIISLALDRRGIQVDSKNIDDSRVMMQFKFPLNEIAVDFYDALKSLSSGYASFDYEEDGFQESDIVKVYSLLTAIFGIISKASVVPTVKPNVKRRNCRRTVHCRTC